MYISGATFEEHCFNISRDILYSVFYHFKVGKFLSPLSERIGPTKELKLEMLAFKSLYSGQFTFINSVDNTKLSCFTILVANLMASSLF